MGDGKGHVKFPDPSEAGPEGVLAVSHEIGVDFLIPAYRSGIFPWPVEKRSILWFAPEKRAVLDFKDLHVPRRLARDFGRADFHFEVNTHFEDVIRECASQPRKGQGGTWITPKLLAAYLDFHKEGYAMSFEALDDGGTLAGGLYGVLMGRYFSGESMFHKRTGASKFALLKTVEWLEGRGLTWLDAQVMTPLLAGFGAHEISRAEFMDRLSSDLRV